MQEVFRFYGSVVIPYFKSKNCCNPSGTWAASSCQVITLQRVRISAAYFTADIT